jgi:hypothetical protein
MSSPKPESTSPNPSSPRGSSRASITTSRAGRLTRNLSGTETNNMSTESSTKPHERKGSVLIKTMGDISDTEAQNSFSADSPYFASYVENEMTSMKMMNDTLHDIAGRTKTFGKCGALMAEATRRLSLACKLRRPYVQDGNEDPREQEANERRREEEVVNRRKAVGEDMASLLSVMADVST